MTRVYVDVEARSVIDITKSGSYRYVYDPSTTPLCVGWTVGNGPILLWWAGDPIPNEWLRPDTIFVCHNAQFDRVFFNTHIVRTRVEQWDDTMIRCRYYGLPDSLDGAAMFLFGEKKDKRGEQLVKSTDGRGVCRPQCPKGCAVPYFNDDPNDLRDLGEYCIQDVHLLRRIDQYIGPLPPMEHDTFCMTERMNDHGIPTDYALAAGAVSVISVEQEKAEKELSRITLGFITSSKQHLRIPKFCADHGYPIPNCQEDTIREALADPNIPAVCRQVLSIRQLGAAAAVEKYKKVLDRICADGRIHGEIQQYVAHTGRYSSRGVQIHNPRRGIPEHYLGYCQAVKQLSPAMMTGWVDWGYHLGTAVRHMFRAEPGYRLVVSDYAGIEARIVAWLVDDLEELDQFRRGECVYIKLAASIFGVDESEIGKKDPRRSVGKESKLSGQYGVGWKTYMKRLAKTWGVYRTPAEARHDIDTFRTKSWRTKAAWKQLEQAWRSACAGLPSRACKCEFTVSGDWMIVTAPNGHSLFYYKPGYDLTYGEPGVFKNETEEVWNEKKGKYVKRNTGRKLPVRKHTYGGALLENIAQWFAGMIAKEHAVTIEKSFPQWGAAKCAWVFFVHDEDVAHCKTEYAESLLKFTEDACAVEPKWCRGLPLKVEGEIITHYRKI